MPSFSYRKRCENFDCALKISLRLWQVKMLAICSDIFPKCDREAYFFSLFSLIFRLQANFSCFWKKFIIIFLNIHYFYLLLSWYVVQFVIVNVSKEETSSMYHTIIRCKFCDFWTIWNSNIFYRYERNYDSYF